MDVTQEPPRLEKNGMVESRSLIEGYSQENVTAQHHDLGTNIQSASRHEALGIGLHWLYQWRTYLLIVVTFLFAILSAVGHLVFFTAIDGLPVEMTLRQSHVTYISLLFATAFRTFLVGSATISFTQNLWRLLRQKLFRISLIEQLSQIHHNLFVLLHLRVFWNAPTPYLMALLLWLAPLATIYPPGALTVVSRPYTFTQNLNISVINPDYPENYDLWAALHANSMLFEAERSNFTSEGEDPRTVIRYTSVSQPLRSLTQAVMASGSVVNIAPPNQQNSSYTLTFRTPQLRCTTSTYNASIMPDNPPNNEPTYTEYDIRWDHNDTLTIINNRELWGYYFRNDTNSNISSIYFAMRTIMQTCRPFAALGRLSVRHAQNTQTISYHISTDLEPISMLSNYGEHSSFTMNDSRTFITQRMKDWNTFALLEAPMLSLQQTWLGRGLMSSQSLEESFMIKGRSYEMYFLMSAHAIAKLVDDDPPLIQFSVFNTERFKSNRTAASLPENLNLTEAMLNQYLANVTISSISLDAWHNMTPVNITEFRNVYAFSRPLSLILPYSICLLLGLLCTILGIWSLIMNGEPARDGGFLQIMTTTRGNTDMDRIAKKYNAGAGKVAEKELLNLEVRYGELVDRDGPEEERKGLGEKRWGFGNVEETVALRRRTRKDHAT